MILETRLYELAEHVQDLLCCDGVSVVLGCSETALRHPLLQRLPGGMSATASLSTTVGYAVSFAQSERLRALCDLAVQSGEMCGLDHFSLPNGVPGSVVVLPLEQPVGVLGWLLLTSMQPETFHRGEYALLAQYRPVLLQKVLALLESSPAWSHGADEFVAPDMHTAPELISVVSHELRTPLAAMKGYVGLLQAYGAPAPAERPESESNVLPAEVQRHYLDSVMEQIDQLEVLVSDLLDATRLQNGHLALQCTQIDLAQLCLHCAENMQHQVDRQQAGSYTIRCDIAAHLPACWANTARVQQVLTNLLENAVKYSPDGGVIEIVVGYQTHLSVTVRDHGVGIPSWQQPDLFKPFARLAHPLTRDVPGSGLGLYITRKLIEAMGGQIRLESSEGHGTCVTFTLPAVEANAPIPVHEVRQKTL